MLLVSNGFILINPSQDLALGCGTGKPVSSNSIHSNLEVNILFLTSEDKKNKILFLSFDTLFVGPRVTSAIIEGLKNYLTPEQIFISGTHTHNATALDETKPMMGYVNFGHQTKVIDSVIQRSIEIMSQIHTPAVSKGKKFLVEGVVSRRSFTPLRVYRNRLRMGEVLQRPEVLDTPEVVSELIEFIDVSGLCLASILIFPCHPVFFYLKETISSDFVGQLRNSLKREMTFSDNHTLIFLQGASGELNPKTVENFSLNPIKLLRQVNQRKKFPEVSIEEFHKWCDDLKNQIMSSEESDSWKVLNNCSGSLKTNLRQILQNNYIKSISQTERLIELHSVDIEGLQIIGVSAELTWDFRMSILGTLPNVTLSGCMRDTFGYLTSEMQFQRGGYEARGHYDAFSIKHLSPLETIEKIGLEIKNLLR
jgi:hypothetical protein